MIYRVVLVQYDVYDNVNVEDDGGTSLGCFSSWDAAEKKVQEDFLRLMEESIEEQRHLWGSRHKSQVENIEKYKAMLPVPYKVKKKERHYSFPGYMFNYVVTPETLDGQ